jgi:DNA repair protein RecN (Recombination protein N)
MLRELHISNLAVISEARIELASGLNCFTGATGAGKSLVIGAIGVLLGLRSPGEMLRPGAEEGRVSGLFDSADPVLLQAVQQLTDVDVSADGGELLLTRKLYASGRSSVSLNGKPITLSMLRQVSEQLVDVHGQHDQQYLLKPANQLDVVDQFGNLFDLRAKYRAVYDQLQAAQSRLAELSTNGDLRRQQLELYQFQAKEIDAAQLDAAEYARLSTRSSVLANLETLKTDAGGVYQNLYEGDDSLLDKLKAMAGTLDDLSALDPALAGIASQVRDATITLEESGTDLSRYVDRLDLDPAELAEVTDRLNTINRVLHKYTGDIDATLALRAELAKKITSLEHATQDLTALRESLAPLRKELKQLGDALTAKRTAVAKQLGPLVERGLADLGMDKAKFTVTVAPAESPTATGFDAVEFIAQTNPGQLAQPLRKIASGGELSRIMLALKGILAKGDRVDVLVFDEIDSNVGGRLGSVIGNKLRSLADSHQVLCITHLPQIASYADRHFTVRKEVVDGKTESQVRRMEGTERLQEIAEMIGGHRITDTTRAQAQELLDVARAEFGAKGTRSGNVGAEEMPIPTPQAVRKQKVARA